MVLLECGFIFNNEKNIIFSNLDTNIIYDSSYDLDSVPIIDWSISETYNDELKEIRFKNHILVIVKSFVTSKPIYCYLILKKEKYSENSKRIAKLVSRIENKKSFCSVDEIKEFLFKNLIHDSLIIFK